MVNTAAPDAQSTWSLQLTNFEEFLRADDHAEYPMEFWFRVTLAGQLDQSRWSESFWQLVETQPFLTARLRRTDGESWELVAGTATQEMLRFEPAPCRTKTPRIDLQQQPGLHCWINQTAETVIITLQCHHVISDALGIFGWLAKVMQRYFALTSPPPVSVSLSALEQRGGPPCTAWQRWLHGPYDILGAAGLLEYVSHRPATLGQTSAVIAGEKSTPAELSLTFTAAETRELLNTSRRLGVTLNDLMATALFRVVHQSLVALQSPETRKPIRIMFPKSLREGELTKDLVANQVGMLFLDRRPGSLNDRWLLWSVHLELSLCKRWKAGRTFLRILDWSRRWFGNMKWLQPQDRATTTAVLSNLGEPWSVAGWPLNQPGLRPELLEFWPPLRPFTAISLGVATTAGRMTISWNWDDRRLTQAETVTLLEQFRATLMRWTEINAPPSKHDGE